MKERENVYKKRLPKQSSGDPAAIDAAWQDERGSTDGLADLSGFHAPFGMAAQYGSDEDIAQHAGRETGRI